MPLPDPFWRTLSKLKAKTDVPAAWVFLFGAAYESARKYLRPVANPVYRHPCFAPCGLGCRMHVREKRERRIAFCPQDPPQADSVELDDEQALVLKFDIAALCRDIAQALKIKTAISQNHGAPNSWQMGEVDFPPNHTLPVYFIMPEGQRDISTTTRVLLSRGRAPLVLLVPESSAIDSETRNLIEDNKGYVLSLDRFVHAETGTGLKSDKTLASMLTATAGSTEPAYMFLKRGEFWSVRWNGGDILHLKDSKGMEYYSFLLEHPRKVYSAFELQEGRIYTPGAKAPSSGIEVAGDTKFEQLRQDYFGLETELQKAEKDGDKAAIERLKGERTVLAERMSKDFNLRGKTRKVNDAFEQARKNVDIALKSVRKRLHKDLPEMEEYLLAAVTVGGFLHYNPLMSIEWNS